MQQQSKAVKVMINKIVLAVATTVVMAVSASVITWLNKKLGDKEPKE